MDTGYFHDHFPQWISRNRHPGHGMENGSILFYSPQQGKEWLEVKELNNVLHLMPQSVNILLVNLACHSGHWRKLASLGGSSANSRWSCISPIGNLRKSPSEITKVSLIVVWARMDYRMEKVPQRFRVSALATYTTGNASYPPSPGKVRLRSSPFPPDRYKMSRWAAFWPPPKSSVL